MADPHLSPDLDAHDRRTVRLYRLGFVITTVALGTTAGLLITGEPTRAPLWWTALGIALSAGHVHLYDKRIRWVLQVMAWVGLLALLGAPLLRLDVARVVRLAGVGLLYASLSGLALKEGFCFRVPFVRAVPVLLAAAVAAQLAGRGVLAGALIVPVVPVMAWLTVRKLTMPLSHDIGDRDAYQV